MHKITPLILVLLMFVVTLAPAASSDQAGPRVTNVIAFDVGRDFAKFMELSKRVGAINEKYASTGKARIWMSEFAGPNSNRVIVTVEYPNMVAMAQSLSKVNASPEWAQLVADAQATEIKPISNSVLVEMPQQ